MHDLRIAIAATSQDIAARDELTRTHVMQTSPGCCPRTACKQSYPEGTKLLGRARDGHVVVKALIVVTEASLHVACVAEDHIDKASVLGDLPDIAQVVTRCAMSPNQHGSAGITAESSPAGSSRISGCRPPPEAFGSASSTHCAPSGSRSRAPKSPVFRSTQCFPGCSKSLPPVRDKARGSCEVVAV